MLLASTNWLLYVNGTIRDVSSRKHASHGSECQADDGCMKFVGLARNATSAHEAVLLPEEEDEQDKVPSHGPPWWRLFPDFVPLCALKWGTNPR